MKKSLLKTTMAGLALFATSSAFAAVGDVTTIIDQTFTDDTTLENTAEYTWGADVQGMIKNNSVYLTNNTNKSNNYTNRDFLTFTAVVGNDANEVNITYDVYCVQDKGQANTNYIINYFNEDGDFVFGVQEWSGGWAFGADIICATAEGTSTTTALPAGHMSKGGGSTVNITVKFSGDNALVEIDGNSYAAYTKTAGIKAVKLSVGGDNGYDRDMQLKNYIVKTTEIEAVTTASYVLEYVCDGVTLKTATKTGLVGDAAAVTTDEESAFTLDDVKYVFVSSDAEGKTISADGSTVVTLTYEVAPKYNWTVLNGLTEEAIATGSCYQGETVMVPYDKYYLKEGVLYQANAINSGYRVSVTPTVDNFEVKVAYNATDITNCVFYAEAENIEGMVPGYGSNADIRCSNAAGASATEDVTITTLPLGTYQLHVSTRTNSAMDYTFVAGEFEYVFTTIKGNTAYGDSEIFELNDEYTPLVVKAAGSANNLLDYIYITGTPGTTAISSVAADAAAADVWYNLQGIRVNEPTQSGLYIHNGEKVYIRK